MKRLIRAALAKIGIRTPRCEWAHLTTTWAGDVKVYIERCVLGAGHAGAHRPGIPTRVTSDEENR